MWSLGIICYEVLMGELPIAQGTTDDMKIAMLLGYATLLLCDSSPVSRTTLSQAGIIWSKTQLHQ